MTDSNTISDLVAENNNLHTDIDNLRIEKDAQRRITGEVLNLKNARIDRLEIAIEKLRETIAAGVQENTLYEQEIEGIRRTSRRLEERLDARPTEADITQLATKCDREWQAGMEAAAKITLKYQGYGSTIPELGMPACIAAAIRAVAKEQADG